MLRWSLVECEIQPPRLTKFIEYQNIVNGYCHLIQVTNCKKPVLIKLLKAIQFSQMNYKREFIKTNKLQKNVVNV